MLSLFIYFVKKRAADKDSVLVMDVFLHPSNRVLQFPGDFLH